VTFLTDRLLTEKEKKTYQALPAASTATNEAMNSRNIPAKEAIWSVNRNSQCTRPRSPSEPQSPGMPNGNEAACGARHAST